MSDAFQITGPRPVVMDTRVILWGFFLAAVVAGLTSLIGCMAIGGLLSQAGTAMAGGAAAAELNGGGRGFWPRAGRFDPTLVAVGVILLLIGLAFEYGTRLQNDTEGLV